MHETTRWTDEGHALQPDLRAAQEFLFLLASPMDEVADGDTVPETKHTFFVVGDNEAAKKHIRAESRYGTLQEHGAWLTRQNQRGAGVFVCIHQMDESGDRKEANFRRIRTIVADHDNGIPTAPPPCAPTMIVNTSPGKQHVYFVVGEETSKEEYVGAQRWLTENWGNDKQVKDVTRVMRLPGFYHRKSVTPHLVTFEVPGGEPAIYSRATIVAKFPTPQNRAVSKSLTVSPDQLPAGLIKSAAPKRYALAEVEEALRVLGADDRADWVSYGHAIKRDLGEAGLGVWLDWSAKSNLFDEADARRRWAGFDVSLDGPDKMHCGTIIQRAKQTKAISAATAFQVACVDVDKLADDLKPQFIRGEIQDPLSVKNVAIFLAVNAITPWHNEFDRNDYLRDAVGHDTMLNDRSVLDLKMRMHTAGLRVSTEFCNDTLAWIASKRTAHPVRAYLNGLSWDGKSRVDDWLHWYCGADDTRYHRLVGSKTLIAAVRRVRVPGCKFDHTLTLEGPQGARKSSVWRTLAGDEYFTDGVLVGAGPKEMMEHTGGKWIAEMAELTGLSRRDVNEVKQSLSKQSDKARLAYGHYATEVPRQFILCGTTNNAQYLKDKTGNRRFWCVAVGRIDIEALKRDRDQLWAEAAHREAQGERIHLEADEHSLAVAEQAKREEDDDLEIAIEELLGSFNGCVVPKTDVYKALGHENVFKGSASIGPRVAAVMAHLGWKSARVDHGGERRRCFIKGDGERELSFNPTTLKFKAVAPRRV